MEDREFIVDDAVDVAACSMDCRLMGGTGMVGIVGSDRDGRDDFLGDEDDDDDVAESLLVSGIDLSLFDGSVLVSVVVV